MALEPITRAEQIMSGESLEPITREEMFLAKAAGMDVDTPEPITRREMFLSKISGGSGGGSAPVVEPLTVTENGTYEAPDGVDGYSPVTVNVVGSGGETIENGIVWDEVNENGKPTKVSFFTTGTTVPKYAFYNYHALHGLYVLMTECHIPETITRIDDDAFYGCSDLVDVNIPDTLQTINANAFYTCSALKITYIPENVVEIGNGAFHRCTAIDEITILGTPWIGNTAFSGCANLLTINVPWAEGEVANAPWGATNATINYNYTGG